MPHTIIINPAPGPGDVLGDAWMWIEMQNAVGRTSAQVADAEIASAGSGFNIGRFEVEIDGGPAVVVDGLPGPDAWRRVFVVHNERLYTLTFLPWVPNTAGAELSPLEELYTIIVQTLRFPPPTKAIPPTPLPWGPGHLPPPLVFEYPTDQQVLDYGGDYWFKVNDFPGEAGFLWSFSQNGVVVWDSLRDEMGGTAGGGYVIFAGSDAHARFVPGPVEVSVRAQFGDFLSDPVVITIILVAPSRTAPVIVYPVNGQVLAYEGSYLFKVEPKANAEGFLWGFFQNGIMVWENLRDEGTISGNDYGIHPGTTAHTRFTPGNVEVWVRASISGQWTDPTVISISLQETVTPLPDCTSGWTGLVARSQAQVSEYPPTSNRVRSKPSTVSDVIALLPPGTVVKLLEGPVCADGLVFWKVKSGAIPGGVGWTAEGDSTEYYLVADICSGRSIVGDTVSSITFVNESNRTVDVYVMSYEGVEVFYNRLAPRQSYVQSTFDTHPWCVRDANTGEALLFVTATATAQTVTIR